MTERNLFSSERSSHLSGTLADPSDSAQPQPLREAVEMAMDTALEMREEEPHHLSLLTTTKPKDDGLSLLEREEKVLLRNE